MQIRSADGRNSRDICCFAMILAALCIYTISQLCRNTRHLLRLQIWTVKYLHISLHGFQNVRHPVCSWLHRGRVHEAQVEYSYPFFSRRSMMYRLYKSCHLSGSELSYVALRYSSKSSSEGGNLIAPTRKICPLAGLNNRPHHYEWRALPLS